MIGSTLSRLGCVLIGHVYPVSNRCSAEHISHMLLKGPLAIWGAPMPYEHESMLCIQFFGTVKARMYIVHVW